MKIKDKILIVEDEQSISNFISMVLNANGYDTIIVGSGEEALTMIASHCPDLIVLDLSLPDMDGMEVLKSVRKWSNLPVVVVSARNHEHDKVDALDYGADDYLVKPFGTSELLARIRTAIRHTRTASGNSGSAPRWVSPQLMATATRCAPSARACASCHAWPLWKGSYSAMMPANFMELLLFAKRLLKLYRIYRKILTFPGFVGRIYKNLVHKFYRFARVAP